VASFKIFSQGDILDLVNRRDGEAKVGEMVAIYGNPNDGKAQNLSSDILQMSAAKFVLLGIPEDVGVRANYGIGGAHTAWKPALKAFLNLQQNAFLKGEDVLVLGEFDIGQAIDADIATLRKIVATIDDLVFPIIQQVVEAGKIPIIIGGGHNNCYPIIKGCALALNKKMNVFNVDAHSDLRNPAEGRHSGNGFSTAINDGFMEGYSVFGLHQNYVSAAQLNYMAKNNVKATYFDDLLLKGADIGQESLSCLNGLNSPLGLEIDLDSIGNMLSSAVIPSGFSLNQLRRMVLSTPKPWGYLHICEGVATRADGYENYSVGKAIAYLISDFIKASLNLSLQRDITNTSV
jgi:formiminoglutamase